MDSWVRIPKKRVGVIIISLFLLLFSSSFVYGNGVPGWDSINPPYVSSGWWLEGVHFTSATEGWAVGLDNPNQTGVLLHYSWGTWTPVTPPSVSSYWLLQGVHFTSPSNGWAVGIDKANLRGVLLHYSRGTWTPVIRPSVSSSWGLYGVHFTSATEGWAVGYDYTFGGIGVLLHYSKNTWTPVTPPPVSPNWELVGVHFTSATEGWAVGFDQTNQTGVLLHYSGGTWTSVTPPSVSPLWWLYGVHFTSPTEGWAVGQDRANNTGVLLHYSGDTWTSLTPPSVSPTWRLFGVHFTSPTEGWAVGWDGVNDSGLLLHFSTWPLSFSSKLNIKGWANNSDLTYGTCDIYPDGTFLLYEDDDGTPRSYTGTYNFTPNGKSILLTLNSNGLSEMQAMLTDRVTEIAAGKGVTVQNISFDFTKVSISKGNIQKKTNAPSKVTIKISGTVNAWFDGVNKTMSFTYQSSIEYYSP